MNETFNQQTAGCPTADNGNEQSVPTASETTPNAAAATKSKRGGKEGDTAELAKSTKLRRSQAVTDFLCECQGFEAGAVCAVAHLSFTHDTEPSSLSEIDRQCLDLYLNDEYDAATVDARQIHDYRKARAKKLWSKSMMYVRRETATQTCMSLMGFASDFDLMKQAKETIENRLKATGGNK